MDHKSIFKKCPNCGFEWQVRDSFLIDPNNLLKGYQVNFNSLKQGLFLFDHLLCKTTMAIKAGEFRDLYNGPVFTKRRTGTEKCPGYCSRPQELSKCPNECDCAWARDVADIISHWKKQPV
ncbi:hypothetical protein KJ762_12505 [bacterium]|nr:hypothetical protein [bacterium]MBU1064248.1 hypothetical protein [bacterium]MBU1635313.1 hypothetical protein [bacterium]MBU1874018.1 hypothetical protein [bacterium]